jgi:hypothetical protein
VFVELLKRLAVALDVAAVIRKNPGFDHAHVKKWLGEFDSEPDSHFCDAFEQVMTTIRL